MAIQRIKVSNFKSFEKLEIELRPLNVVVGGNAAGKSNFIEIFRFLRDLGTYGLGNAVSLQGGMEYLVNLQIGPASPFVLEVEYDDDDFPGAVPETYRLALSASLSGEGFEIREEVHLVDLGDGVVPTTRTKSSRFPDLPFNLEIYDLEPKLSKKAIPLGGKVDLEPDGSNLALVLRNVLQDTAKRHVLVALVRDLLPFVEDLRVERFADKSLLIALREQYSKGAFLPASLLSDGTLQLTAIILALYFERSGVAIIEEPERNIHPHLISKLAGMLQDASRHKQIIVTTHNPDLLKHIDIADLLLVSRDGRGFSRISRPAESEELKIFLANNLGIDELYEQDLLGVKHGV